MNIHRLALVDPSAKLGQDVQIGPFCVVEEDACIGDGTILEARVTIKRGTILGKNNHVFEGATLGGLPQCVGLSEEDCGATIIGDGNIIRENVTIHRSMHADGSTTVGDDCMLMANVHIAHDCHVADEVIMANNAMLAGHVTVGRRAFVSGAAGAHQFVRIGAFAMVGGQAHLVRDVPPFVTVDGLSSQVVGLNLVGLRRAGFTSADVKTLKNIYRILYKSDLNWREIVEKVENEYTDGVGLEMARFLATTSRGVTTERSALPTVSAARENARANDQQTREQKVSAKIEGEQETIQLRVVDENGASLLPPPSKRRVG
ncbi:MAG: acyl-ACP--UDP-N-acetylglucosamine O-acyltransferase [Planctomycetia bacterium]|nr:acyl-ACP--UDP-N-acetylglucosamine O-acyltransferase [Planctomycetia bacterium]